MKSQLPKILEAIAATGGEYFQPTVLIHDKETTIPWRHCGNFNGTILTFDNRLKKPEWASVFREGGKRFNFRKTSDVAMVVRAINKCLAS